MSEHSAEITVTRDDAQANYDGFDEFAVSIRNPPSAPSPEVFNQTTERVRDLVDFSRLALPNGRTKRHVGRVVYTDDEVVDVEVY